MKINTYGNCELKKEYQAGAIYIDKEGEAFIYSDYDLFVSLKDGKVYDEEELSNIIFVSNRIINIEGE